MDKENLRIAFNLFRHAAARFVDTSLGLLGNSENTPPAYTPRKRHAKVSTKDALRKLPKVLKELRNNKLCVDKMRATTWHVLIDDKGMKYPKIGVIKPKTGKLELREVTDGCTQYRICTITEILDAAREKRKAYEKDNS